MQFWNRTRTLIQSLNVGNNNGRFLEPCELEIWRKTLKNNRAPLLCCFQLCGWFHCHMWIQTGVRVRKRLSLVLTSVTLTFDLWPWPFAWTSLLTMVITPENCMMIRWWEHGEKGVTDRRTDGRTDGRTENTIYWFRSLHCIYQLLQKKHSIATITKLRSSELLIKTPLLHILYYINGLTHDFWTRTGGWEFDHSHGAGTSSPPHWQQVEEQAPKPVGWTMCFLLMTLVPVQKLCVNIYVYIYVCTFLIRVLL